MMSIATVKFAGIVHRTVQSRMANHADKEITVTLKVPILFKEQIDRLAGIEGAVVFLAQEQD